MGNFLHSYLSKDIFMRTYTSWRNSRTLRLGAGIAYYGIFALIPLLIIMGSLSLVFFDNQQVVETLQEVIDRAFGEGVVSSEDIASAVVDQDTQQSGFGAVEIISLVSHIVSASFIFLAYKDALNTIWEDKVVEGIRPWIRQYVIAYIVVLMSSTVLLGVLVINSVSSLAKYLIPGDTIFDGAADLIMAIVSLVFGVLFVALVNRILIYKQIPWGPLLKGAVLTVGLILIGTSALSFYLSNVGYRSLYSAVGSIFLVLIWIYYQAQMMLIGAHYTKTLYEKSNAKS